jgi:hypothetical protein
VTSEHDRATGAAAKKEAYVTPFFGLLENGNI